MEIVKYHEYTAYEFFWFRKNDKSYAFVVFCDCHEQVLVVNNRHIVVAELNRSQKSMARAFKEVNKMMKNNKSEMTLGQMMGIRWGL